MSALDFPSSPAVGQLYMPSAGQPGYVWDGTVWKIIALPDNNPASGLRNILMNGSLNVAQRNFPGAGFVGSCWTFDRWQFQSAGSSGTMSAPYATFGDPNVPGEPRYQYVVAVTSVAGAGNYACWYNQIENVRQLAGGKATASFSIKGDAGKFFTVEIAQVFGTGGSPSPITYATPQKLGPCNGAWQRYAVTFDIPSIVGKTIGTNADSYLWLLFWLDAGSSFNARSVSLGQQSGNWAFAQLQLEKGIYPSYPDRRPTAYDLALCQRYYETGTQYQLFPSPNGSGYGHTFTVSFKVPKRVNPTMGRNFTSQNAVSNGCYGPATSTMWDNFWILGNAFTNISQTYQWTAGAD